MKRFLTLVLSGALVLSLASCGEKAPKPFDPNDTAQALLTSGAFGDTLEPVDADTACALYGIDPATVTGAAVYMANATTAEELAVFTLSNADAAQTAAKQLGYRVEDRMDSLASYLPAEVAKLEGAILETRGASVLLAVCSDYAAARSALGL